MFFAATDAELRRAFVGCKRPLPTPSLRTVVNPFTKRPEVRREWIPHPTDHESFAPLVGPSIGHRVASLPHLDVELDAMELASALATLTGDDEQHWTERMGNPPALVDPRSERYEWNVWELPVDAIEAVLATPLPANEEMGVWLPRLAALVVDARAAGRRVYFWC